MTPLTDERLIELRRLAEAATPGEWRWSGDTPPLYQSVYSRTGGPFLVGGVDKVIINADPSEGEYNWAIDPEESDAAFLEAANPQTVLELLDALATERTQNEWLREALEAISKLSEVRNDGTPLPLTVRLRVIQETSAAALGASDTASD